MNKQTYPFTRPPLPYAYDALEPAIDRKTMQIHHDILFQGYIMRLNAALLPYPALHACTLQDLLHKTDLPIEMEADILFNAGGVFNHNLYFASMTPHYKDPSPYMMRMLQCYFSTYENFIETMLAAGQSVKGSGWAWLVLNKRGNLNIITTKDQETPLSHDAIPLLPLDVWEHAYFLQYVEKRMDYSRQWTSLINWDIVEQIVHQI